MDQLETAGIDYLCLPQLPPCAPAGKARRSRAVNTLTGKPTRDSQALEAEIAWLTTEIARARARLVTAQRGADEPFWQTPIGRSGFRSKASSYRMSRTYPPTVASGTGRDPISKYGCERRTSSSAWCS